MSLKWSVRPRVMTFLVVFVVAFDYHEFVRVGCTVVQVEQSVRRMCVFVS